MPDRQKVLKYIADIILELPTVYISRIGIDGVDGAGKTIFGDELSALLAISGRTVIRASVDSFHNPENQRYRLGKNSPEGFFLDSYNYHRLKEVLLDPLSPGGTGLYKTEIFNHRLDSSVSSSSLEQQAISDSILIFDGIFLHRPNLRMYWDFSIFLEVGFDISIPRGAQRGEGSPDPRSLENRRYVEGQKIYLRECDPKKYATIVINNENLESPYIVT
jgi:uridine kinase